MPKAPGTWGTIIALPIYFALAGLPMMFYLAVVALMFVFGIWICHTTARDLNVHDHPGIVWDEIVGYLITMIAVPVEGWWWLMGFVLFRLFDITKPFPIRQLDRQVKGGFGIMVDDVVAALYAALVLQLIIRLL
ncbi:MAG: phosphatidylglycerophosphatase A [Gammaproteobacteria bacterium]|nr:phosphatidylglycerophosphatase A [Gammaproteobacteria bacterium]